MCGNQARRDEDALCSRCCGDEEEEDELLLCEDYGKCGFAIHRSCHAPPLSKIPDGSWYCPKCSTSRAKTLQTDIEIPIGVGTPKAESRDGKAPKSKKRASLLDKTPKDGERKSLRASLNTRHPLAEKLARITALYADSEDSVREEAETGNMFGRVALAEQPQVGAGKQAAEGDQEEEQPEPAELWADLTRCYNAPRRRKMHCLLAHHPRSSARLARSSRSDSAARGELGGTS